MYGFQALSDHWISEASFNYFCPNQFKGKLAISLEIEDLGEFKRTGITNITLSNSAVTNLKATNTASFPTAGSIYINSELLTYTAKDSTSFTIPSHTFVDNGLIGDKISLVTTIPNEVLAGSVTSIVVNDATGFPTTGSITITGETPQVFTYTSINGNISELFKRKRCKELS